MQICSSENCFGCSACADSCPVEAISMGDSTGFYRPVIDTNKCISCGRCEKVCISNTLTVQPDLDTSVPCFAIYAKDDQVHYEATSGGFCTQLSKAFIEAGGVVAGAWWNPEKQVVEHRICETVSEIEYLKKSKYVQSNTEGIYKEIAKIVKQRKCLFVGVPCQVYALKAVVRNNQENLFCVDLLCRGGSSSACLKEHIKQIFHKKAQCITFRGGDDNCCLVLMDENGKKIYRGDQFVDPYFNYFMKHVLFQERCYECPFAGKQRIGDVTAGDYWGLPEEAMPESGGRGINMVFENTDKGAALLTMIKEQMIIKRRTAEEAVKENETLQSPTPIPEEYHKLWEKIRKDGFVEALNMYSPNDYKTRVRQSNIRYMKLRLKQKAKMLLPTKAVVMLKKLRNK